MIQRGPADQCWESKRIRRAMIQETSDVEKIEMELYFFLLGTMELTDGVVSFSSQDLAWIIVPHEDSFVLLLKIVGFQVYRVFVDPGSSANLLYILAYKQMAILISALGSPSRVLTDFNGSTTQSLREIVFPVEVGSTALNVRFLVMSDPTPYNTILG